MSWKLWTFAILGLAYIYQGTLRFYIPSSILPFQTQTYSTMSSPPSNVVSLRNRCSESKSPYVRSHLDNPTAWQLWTPETLELARKTNRLLFVSIGYSACHW